MKILYVIDRLGIEYGGSAAAARNIAKAMANRNHDVTVYCSDVGTFDLMNGRSKVKIFNSRILNINLYLKPFPITPTIPFADFKNFDIIHCHNYYTFQNFALMLHKHDIPVVLQPHGSLVCYDKMMKHNILFPVVDKFWRKYFLFRINKTICVSKQETKQAGSLHLRYTTVPDGIDAQDFYSLPTFGEFRRKHDISDKTKIVLSLGRNHWIKNLEMLREAYKKIEGENTKLVILHDVYGRDKLEALVDADVFVLPSRYEIFGIMALEALACGTPVVTSQNCGINDYFKEPVLFPARGLHDMAYLIYAILRSDTKQKHKQQRIEAAKQYDWSIIAKKMEKVYSELI